MLDELAATGRASFSEVRPTLGLSQLPFFACSFPAMYLLYLDESGNEKGAEDRHFALTGVAAFERQTCLLEQALNQIQAARFPGLPPEPVHSSWL